MRVTVGVRVAARYGAVGMENRRGLRSITFICLHVEHMYLSEPARTVAPPNGTLRGPHEGPRGAKRAKLPDERSPAPPSVAHTFTRNYDHIWVGEGRLGKYGGPGCSGFKRAVLAFGGGGENVGPPGGTAGPKRAQRMLWAS